jgi:homoserine dehydrogenase
MGVMNGTCNYILTRMQSAGLPYEQVFEEARQLGYLEADPNLDVGGIDAGHKLSLLAAIAFGTRSPSTQCRTGRHRQCLDRRHPPGRADMGYRIKLLGVAQMTGRGLEQRMTPCLVPADSPLASCRAAPTWSCSKATLSARSCCAAPVPAMGPTASAVMADVIDIARGFRCRPSASPPPPCAGPTQRKPRRPAPYYLRMTLLDKPGALAKIATAWAMPASPSTRCASTATRTPTPRS